MTQAQPMLRKRQVVENQAVVKLLLDNIDTLEHPLGAQLVHPYFYNPLNPNREGLNEIRKRWCEGITLVFENENLLKQPAGSEAIELKSPKNMQAIQLLADNLANLAHPRSTIKCSYFQTICNPNPEGAKQMAKEYAVAVVWLLEKHDRMKKPPGRPRKDV